MLSSRSAARRRWRGQSIWSNLTEYRAFARVHAARFTAAPFLQPRTLQSTRLADHYQHHLFAGAWFVFSGSSYCNKYWTKDNGCILSSLPLVYQPRSRATTALSRWTKRSKDIETTSTLQQGSASHHFLMSFTHYRGICWFWKEVYRKTLDYTKGHGSDMFEQVIGLICVKFPTRFEPTLVVQDRTSERHGVRCFTSLRRAFLPKGVRIRLEENLSNHGDTRKICSLHVLVVLYTCNRYSCESCWY